MKENIIPLFIAMGRLDGVSKKDAGRYSRDLINKFIDDPANGSFRVIKRNSFVYYEIQEGGDGKSYLSSAIDAIEKGTSSIFIPAGKRGLRINVDESGPSFHLLPEKESVECSDFIFKKGSMTPFQTNSRITLIVGTCVFAFGLTTLLAAGSLHLSRDKFDMNSLHTRSFDRSFHSGISEMESLKDSQPYRYVKKFHYTGRKWEVVTERVNSDRGRTSYGNPDSYTELLSDDLMYDSPNSFGPQGGSLGVSELRHRGRNQSSEDTKVTEMRQSE